MFTRFLRFSEKVVPPLSNRRIPLALVAAGVLGYTWQERELWSADSQELRACAMSDLVEGVMKKVQVGENQNNFIVIAPVNGQVYAVGGKCSHFGAPMQMGYLDGFNMYCPWHLAQFDIRSGKCLTGPGIKSLPSYPVEVRNGEVFVKIPSDQWESVATCVDAPMAARDPSNTTKFVIVGGGAAGHYCAETLRREGFTGEIVLLSKDKNLAYDRTLLSKAMKLDPSNSVLRPQSFYDQYGIDFKTDKEVSSIDAIKKEIKLQDGSVEKYDKVLMASGSTARVFPFYQKYLEMPNVVTLRNAEDHTKLKQQLESANNIVIVGGSFIGLEAATGIRRAFPDKKVTIVEMLERPLEHIFGPDISRQLVDLQKLNGVEVIAGKTIKNITVEDGKVTGISIPGASTFLGREKEDTIPTDALIIATGASIQTSYAPPAILNSDGSVRVNSYMQTSNSDIYAAGDIASFLSTITERSERIEHWAVAQEQAQYAAYNMLGKGKPYLSSPFFWSNQFVNVQFTGFSAGHDGLYTEVRAEGTPDKQSQITYFFKEGRCIGAAAINCPGAVLRMKIAFDRGLMPSQEEVVNGNVRFEKIAERVSESLPKRPCCKSKK